MHRVPLDRGLARARRTVSRFLESVDRAERLVVFCHFDADGLAAGALFGRGLPRIGFTDVVVEPTGRGESAFSDAARMRLRRLEPGALIVADLGVRREGGLEGVPTLYVDHHRPDGRPAGAAVVSGYRWEPVPSAAWIVYEVLEPLADVQDLAWIAAVGVIGDLGDQAPWPRLPEIKKRYTAKWVKEAVSLVNAARRASAFDVATPLRALMRAKHPWQIAEDDTLGAERLQAYREEVKAELARARRRPPVFSRTRPFALVTLHSACQIHPVVAELWTGRLRDYAVIAANTGYLPGVVAFSVRTARRDLKLPELLRRTGVGTFEGRFAQGHDRASGGHLPRNAFNRMLDALGFDALARLPTE